MENDFEIIEKRDPIFHCKCCYNLFYKEDIDQNGLCFICANGDYKPPQEANTTENDWWDL